MSAAIIMLRFDETQQIAPSDRCGNLADLGIQAPLTPAISVRGWSGGGRNFSPTNLNGFVAADNPAGNTLLTRDCTIQVLAQINLALSSQPMTIIARGIDGAASEYYALGLEVQAASVAGDVDVRWFWAGQDGTIHTQAAATYTSPGNHSTVLLTATRRWESTTRVVCRYYVADHLLAEVVSTDGAIGGGTTGHTSVGARKTAGTWGRYFGGVIEQLVIHEYEMSAEEIEARWRRMAVHQPEGVERWRAMQPPGAPWSRNPDAIIARLIKVWGQLGGLGAAMAEEVRNLLPDRAYLEVIERWERIVGLAPRPLDSLDTRRSRVVSYLSRENGYSLPVLRSVLAPLFDLSGDDVQILELDNEVNDSFDAIDPLRWDARSTSSAWSVSSGQLRLHIIEGDQALPTDAHWLRTPILAGDNGGPANGIDTLAQVKISSVAAWPSSAANLIAGLWWYEYLTGDKMWVGLTKSGANYVLAHRRLVGGVLSALTTIATIGASPVLYLRCRRTAAATSMVVEYSTTGFATALASATIPCPPAPSYVGLSASADGLVSGADLDMLLDDFKLRCPLSVRSFVWYAYRNPALAGRADMVGADTLVRRYKPAHTHAAAITQLVLVCDDPATVCDGGPLGGF